MQEERNDPYQDYPALSQLSERLSPTLEGMLHEREKVQIASEFLSLGLMWGAMLMRESPEFAERLSARLNDELFGISVSSNATNIVPLRTMTLIQLQTRIQTLPMDKDFELRPTRE
jgi:hypothetical protein